MGNDFMVLLAFLLVVLAGSVVVWLEERVRRWWSNRKK
jgi:hypothetical protein